MSSSKTLSPLKRFYRLLQVDRQDILSIYVYALFNGIVSLSLPLGIQAIINLTSGGQISTSWILLVVFVIAGVAFTGIMQIMQLTVSENLQQKIFTRSAFEFAYRIPRLQTEAVNRTYIPELVNRFFDTLSVQKGLSKILIDFSTASFQVVIGLILLSIYHPFFILFSVILLGIVYLIFHFTATQGLKTSLAESKYKYEVAHWLEELGRTMETFKLAGKSELPLNKTDEVVSGYLLSRKAHFRTLVKQYINLVGFKVIIAAGLLLIGSLLVINQQMNIGQFVASEIIIILVMASVEKLILSMETIYDVLTAIEKIGKVTDIPIEANTGTKQISHKVQGFDIQLDKLTYRFKNTKRDALKNVTLDIKAGEKICISGFNNSGKSLLLQIIAGIFEHFSGSITFDDIPLKNWCKEDLRLQIGDCLTQEDIFKGTLEENLTIGRPGITLDQIKAAVAAVQLTSYIAAQPNGYGTMLKPEGRDLPRSIRTKIILARSIVGTPKLVLMEDNLNHLSTTEKNSFVQYLLSTDSTIILLSNEEKIAKLFDRTVILDNGKVLAYDKLSNLKDNSWYHQIFKTQ